MSKITTYIKSNNPGENYEFGNAVSTSGDALVVGERFEASAKSGISGAQVTNCDGNNQATTCSMSGAAYI